MMYSLKYYNNCWKKIKKSNIPKYYKRHYVNSCDMNTNLFLSLHCISRRNQDITNTYIKVLLGFGVQNTLGQDMTARRENVIKI